MDIDINELIKAATEGFDLSNFKGDVVGVKKAALASRKYMVTSHRKLQKKSLAKRKVLEPKNKSHPRNVK